ncbi:MAG TPA: efflux RND transporter periplasmic adaptor subunit [Steroidobacteraceae bacterium]|jgi:multidrug efflux system membrane fusion protein|nr:efflux RND transporter periplasmic adaptor subunit [Steroidobacteraceae bacterium]
MRSWKLVPIAFIAAAAIGMYALLSQRPDRGATHQDPPATPVTVATVERRDVPVVVEGLGTVRAYNTVTVRPLISGQIADIDFMEGQRVRPGDVLARLDSRLLEAQLHQAQATSLSDRARLDYAREQLKRLESEGAQGFVSRQLVDSQRSQLAVLKATAVADEASVRSAAVQLSYTIIRAPIPGITGIRMVDRGNVISPSDPGIVVITQIKPIAVVFTLSATALAGLPEGRSAGTPAVAFDAQDRKPLATGTLELVDNRIDPVSNTARLKAIFANADAALRPGEFVNIHLRKSLLRDVVTVPRRAIQYGQAAPFVWLLRPGSTVALRPIQLGVSNADHVEVTHGLAAGDRVVVEGQYGLEAGARVRVQALPVAPSSEATDLAVP